MHVQVEVKVWTPTRLQTRSDDCPVESRSLARSAHDRMDNDLNQVVVIALKACGDNVRSPAFKTYDKCQWTVSASLQHSSRHLTILNRSTRPIIFQVQPHCRLPIAIMAKDMMQSGKDLDAMEHGADMKHGVQPSEPSRGTGTVKHSAYLNSSMVMTLVCTQLAQWSCTLAAHCAALLDLKCLTCTHPGTMDRKGNYFVPDSKRFHDQLPNSADQSAKW